MMEDVIKNDLYVEVEYHIGGNNFYINKGDEYCLEKLDISFRQ